MHVSEEKGISVIKKDKDVIFFDPESLVVVNKKGEGFGVDDFLSMKYFFDQKRPKRVEKELVVYLLTSNDCNLKCKYCFASGGNYGEEKGKMDKETIDKAFEFLKKNFSHFESYRFTFFGGEPYLFPELMDYAVQVSKRMKKKCRFLGITNGTIANDKLMAVLSKNKISTLISLDGPKEVQDGLRITKTGYGSYDLIEKNLKKFKSLHKKLTFLITLTPHNSNLVETYFHFKKLGASSMRFDLVRSCESSFNFKDDDIEALKKEYTKLAEIYLKDLLTEDHPVNVVDFTKVIKRLLWGGQRESGCEIGRAYLMVAHNGAIYPCHYFVGRKEYCLGHVDNKFDWDDFEKYDIPLESKEECQKCPAKYLCGGGCYYNFVEKSCLSVNCQLTRHIANLAIWIYSKLANLKKEKLLWIKKSI